MDKQTRSEKLSVSISKLNSNLKSQVTPSATAIVQKHHNKSKNKPKIHIKQKSKWKWWQDKTRMDMNCAKEKRLSYPIRALYMNKYQWILTSLFKRKWGYDNKVDKPHHTAGE